MATATSFTSGEVIRNAKVTPSGIPPFTNPINNGTELQEQKGVTAPNNDAKKYSNPKSLFLDRKLRTLSTGKYEFTAPITEVMMNNKIKILIVSYMKKLSASPALLPSAIRKTEYTSQSAKFSTQSNIRSANVN